MAKTSIQKIARIYKVAPNTIRKWAKWYELELPKHPRGYWVTKDKLVRSAEVESATNTLKVCCSTVELRAQNTENIK